MLDRTSQHFIKTRRQIIRTQSRAAISNKPTIQFVMGLCKRAMGKDDPKEYTRPASLNILLDNYKRAVENEYFPGVLAYDVRRLDYPISDCAILGGHICDALEASGVTPLPPLR